MTAFFDIQNIVFSVWGYGVCWLELIGFFTGFTSIYLAGRANVATFFVGLFNCVIYFAIFLQQHLYSMMLMQVMFFCINIYGIVKWGIPNKKRNDKQLKITTLSPQNLLGILLLTVFGGIAWGALVEYLADIIPSMVLSEYVCIDALLFVANVIGQILLTRKKIENWVIWIIVDSVSLILLVIMGLYLSALLYLLYILISINALNNWYKEMKKENPKQKNNNHICWK